MLVAGRERGADVIGEALVGDAVDSNSGFAVLDDVAAQLVQDPGHVIARELPGPWRGAAGAGGGGPGPPQGAVPVLWGSRG